MAEGGRKRLDWQWEEIVLACDLVVQNGWRQIDHGDPRAAELSHLLQRFAMHPEELRLPNFRSTGSVAHKTADIATSHPDYQGKRKNGNRLDRKVMDEFIAKKDAMHAIAETIRSGIAAGEPPDFPREVGYENESEMEGRYLLRMHAYRERDRSLRKKKIDSVLAVGGRIACEVCAFDFGRTYGERGEGYIECHHVEPLHVGGQKPRSIDDLALLCSNCHRMIHTKPPWPTPDELPCSSSIKRGSRELGDTTLRVTSSFLNTADHAYAYLLIQNGNAASSNVPLIFTNRNHQVGAHMTPRRLIPRRYCPITPQKQKTVRSCLAHDFSRQPLDTR